MALSTTITNQQLVAAMVQIRNQIDHLTADLQELQAELTSRYAAGLAPGKLKDPSGWSIAYSPGKATYSWPADIEARRAELKEAETFAIQLGTATPKPLKPYWILRKPKPQQS